MRKSVLTTVFALISLCSFAQIKLGPQIVYGTEMEFGVGAKASFKVTDEIHISPNINYFFGKKVAGVASYSAFTINADGHYLFPMEKGIVLYPLAGVNFTRSTATVSFLGKTHSASAQKLGLNIGGGVNYEFTPSIIGVAEVKYVISKFDQAVFSVGTMFKL